MSQGMQEASEAGKVNRMILLQELQKEKEHF